MKFKNAELTNKNTKVVSFIRPDKNGEPQNISFIVGPVPRSFFRKMQTKGAYAYVTAPEVPKRVKPGSDRYVMVDGVVQYTKDFQDPKYIEESNRQENRIVGLKLWKALQCDPNVSWDATEPSDSASAEVWGKFADDLYDEACAFEDGEIKAILKAVDECDLVTAKQETETEVLKDFSSRQ